MLSMFSIRRGNLALSLFPSLSLSLCFESCIGRRFGQAAGHTEHVIRTAYRHPAGHRVHLPLTQKHKSHQGNTGSKAAHKAQTCGGLLNAGQPRQRHRNHKSVTATHTWHELHTGSLFNTTAAAEPLSPATGWPALIEINLHSLIISCGLLHKLAVRSWSTFDHKSLEKRTKPKYNGTNISFKRHNCLSEWCWDRSRMSNEDRKRVEKNGLLVSVCDWDQALCYVLLSTHRTCLDTLLMTRPRRNLLLWMFLSMPQHISSTNLIYRTSGSGSKTEYFLPYVQNKSNGFTV